MANIWIDVDTAVTVPVNVMPLIDDTDFKTREVAIAYDESGMDLVWNFQTTAGVTSQTAVTPTTDGDYDWSHSGDGMYKIEIPDSGGGDINNDAEGFGWFTGIADGVLPWTGPIIGFRAAGLNALLIDSAFSPTRGLTGTAVPAAAADGVGGLPISDAGGLDLDTLLGTLASLSAETRNANVLDQIKTTIAVIESQRGHHTHQPSTGSIFFIDQTNGDTHANGARGGITDPYSGWQDAHDNAGTDHGHDLYIMVAGAAGGATTHVEDILPTNGYSFTRGPGRDLIWTPTDNLSVAIDVISTDGCMFSAFQLDPFNATGVQNGIEVEDSDFFHAHGIWFNATRGDALELLNCSNFLVTSCVLQGSGAGGTGHGLQVLATVGSTSNYGEICGNIISDVAGDGVQLSTTGGGTIDGARICDNLIHGSTDDGVDIIDSGVVDTIISNNVLGNNASNDIEDNGTTTIKSNNYDLWDRPLTGATHNIPTSAGRILRELDEQVGYEESAIWLNTLTGTSGTVVGENGTVSNPSDNITDTIALAVATGRVRIRVASGSTVTLAAPLEGYEIYNSNWTLVLAGQSISGSCITGANVSGIATGAAPPKLIGCSLGSITLPPCKLMHCGIGVDSGTFTLVTAGDYTFVDCFSLVPGPGQPEFVMTGTGAATGINNRGWKGGAAYTLDSDITLSHEVIAGGGTTVTTGGANVEIRGTTRSITLVLSNAGTVQFVGTTGPMAISGTATTTVNLYGVSSSLADTSVNTTVTDATTSRTNYNGGDYGLSTDANGRIRIVDGTGAGEINTDGGAIVLVDAVTNKAGYTLTSADHNAIAAALLDLASAVDGKTVRQTLRYVGARMAGKLSGAGTGTEVCVGMDGVTNRASYTVDSSGNITAVSYDP